MKDPHDVFLSAHDAAELRALPGSVVMATLRNGWPFTIRILDATPATEQETT